MQLVHAGQQPRQLFFWAGWLALSVLLAACSHGHKNRGQAGRPQRSAASTSAGTLPLPNWQPTDPKFAALPGARALYGTLDRAVYEIEVPDNWNGQLVMYAHGYVGFEPFLIVQPPPLRAYLIKEGFAWAASSFSANGYSPQGDIEDTLALLDYFKRAVGPPARTYIYGTSMGGHVVTSSLEQYPDAYNGGLSECGVVAGVKEMDYLVSYAAVAQFLTGVQLLPVQNARAYMAASDRLIPELGGSSGQSLSNKGRAFENVMENLTGGPRPFRHEGFLNRLADNFTLTAGDLTYKTPASRAGTNVGVTYRIGPGFNMTDAQLDAGIYRQPADPAVRDAETNPALAPLTGQIRVPLLTLHTTGDAYVPFSMEQDYRRLVDTAGRGDLLVQRAIRRPDHCQFTPAEQQQAWDDLVKWVEHGVKPAGDDVLRADLSPIGLNWTKPLLPGDPGGL